MRTVPAYSKHKSRRKKFKRAQTIVYGPNHTLQCDLIDYKELKHSNPRYILTCIDIFSRYAHVRVLKSKTGPLTADALRDIFETMISPPAFLGHDRGSEFLNPEVKDLCNSYNIKQIKLKYGPKAAVAERFNLTLKRKLEIYMDHNKTKKFVPALQLLVNGYNNSVHRTIKMKPADVNFDNAARVRAILYPNKRSKKPCSDIHIGDKVRALKYKGVFTKGYKQNFSSEIYQVVNTYRSLNSVCRYEEGYLTLCLKFINLLSSKLFY